uniref:Uncharacterized protein n=1 Tax=Arundo donax TaxID=35708 RepID=A0A0A9F362_ARUDO
MSSLHIKVKQVLSMLAEKTDEDASLCEHGGHQAINFIHMEAYEAEAHESISHESFDDEIHTNPED